MKINNLRQLLSLLGEEEAKKYINVEDKNIEILIHILQKTYVRSVLNSSMLKKFCNRIIYADYKEVYATVLIEIGKIPISKENLKNYKSLLTEYINTGYNTEKKYQYLLDRVKELQQDFKYDMDFDKIQQLLEEELKYTREKTSVKKFLENGGSLEDVIALSEASQLEELNENTILATNSLTFKEPQTSPYYQVKVSEIGFLISRISELSLEEDTEKELIQTYYQGLDQGKIDGFQEEFLTVENKPNLFSLLKKQGFSAIPVETDAKEKNKIKSL